ncbi:MAG TPA: cobaltochelatase subunit CobN, partial [Roseateles sp.]|nr:cobaltochelatase subunit CobN [Roseateles sp.]
MALLLSLLLAPAWAASAAPGRLLWITLDVTPPARHALIEREAAAAGLTLKSLDYPLRTAVLDAAQARELEGALRAADAVWIDAPHASVESKLQALVGPAVKSAGKSATWIPAGEPAAGERTLRAYLQAGGAANTRAAFALLQAQLAQQPAPDLPAPALLPQRGVYLPGAPGLFASAQDLARWTEARGEGKRPAVAAAAASLPLRAGRHRLDRRLAAPLRQAGPLGLRSVQLAS